ncbi:unnamed protein product [Pylaiella littoralis]
MFPSDAVIGLPDETAAPLEYDLVEHNVDADENLSANQEISGATISQVSSVTTLSFARPLSPNDTSKVAYSAEEGEQAIFIWAHGSSNELAFHEDWGNVQLSDLSCSSELAAAEDAAVTAAEDCTSSDPDFEFEVSVRSDLTLFWIVADDETSVSVKAVYDGEGWLGIGFSDSGKMPGSDAVIGLPGDETVLEYDLDGYSTPVQAAQQEISNATITQAAGVTNLTFVRLLEPSGDGKQVLTVSDPTDWLYAVGVSNIFVEHAADDAAAFVISLDSCIVGGVTGGTPIEYAHGWLMVLGWTVLFPAGIMFGRFSRSFKDVGFPAHRLLQTSGSLLVIAGFIIAISFTEDKNLDHFGSGHGKSGLILVTFVVLQVVAAIFRPSKPASDSVVLDVNGERKPEPLSKTRLIWKYLHRGFGYIAVIWAIFQCFDGLEAVNAEQVWEVLYAILAVGVVVAFLVLQAFACFKLQRDSPVDYSGPRYPAASHEATAGTN